MTLGNGGELVEMRRKKRVITGVVAFGVASTALVRAGQATAPASASAPAPSCTVGTTEVQSRTYDDQAADVRNSP